MGLTWNTTTGVFFPKYKSVSLSCSGPLVAPLEGWNWSLAWQRCPLSNLFLISLWEVNIPEWVAIPQTTGATHLGLPLNIISFIQWLTCSFIEPTFIKQVLLPLWSAAKIQQWTGETSRSSRSQPGTQGFPHSIALWTHAGGYLKEQRFGLDASIPGWKERERN